MDNGKNFQPIQLKSEMSMCSGKKCRIKLDLECSTDFIKNNFPQKWIVKFKGTYQKQGSVSRHTFISFDGGKNWKILDSRIDKLVILNNGGLMFGTGRMNNLIFFSYDEGLNWYKNTMNAENFTDIIPLWSPNNHIIAVVNHNKNKNLYTLFKFSFSNVISRDFLTIDTTCNSEDFETWYVRRYFGSCFQGEEVSYMKIHPLNRCSDNRTVVRATTKPCPCSLEDFPWYSNLKHSEPYYYYKDNYCAVDPYFNFTEPVKTCRNGGIPLVHLEGY
ncbi:VPS10 domain-containing receptor SorCS3 [Thelohanellus kitauei]|uniref:VPS10 domain-containing receptor SorCS3 n=1 Tax=Thelohanellus kitauei TaxID=669202 RepID=A0A0C2MPG1_THEKT|nr:VPS10 domain-containing receptor SorCS3 [Thelohanellus kitauei]